MRCKYPLCRNTAYYNYKIEEYQKKKKRNGTICSSPPPLFCQEHKHREMINVLYSYCIELYCKESACYNNREYVTNDSAKWCYTHFCHMKARKEGKGKNAVIKYTSVKDIFGFDIFKN